MKEVSLTAIQLNIVVPVSTITFINAALAAAGTNAAAVAYNTFNLLQKIIVLHSYTIHLET